MSLAKVEYQKEGDIIQFACASAVTAGTPIITKEFGVLIPIASADAAATAAYHRCGIFTVAIADGITVVNGDDLYYTVATGKVTTTRPTSITSAVFYLGRAVKAGTATAGYVDVEIFKGSQGLSIYKRVDSGADEVASIWATTAATSGIFRGLSVRTFFSVAGTETGDALRVYNQTDVSIANMHGMHCTAQLGAEDAASVGTVTGAASGVRATIGIGQTNTATAGGTIASLRLDSYFLSTAAHAASSFIYAMDVGTSFGVDSFLRLGAIYNRQTSAASAADGPYTYHSTMTQGNCVGALKVVTPDGTMFIPLLTSLS